MVKEMTVVPIDHEFLDAVGTEIARALERATELEAGLGEFADAPEGGRRESLERMSACLADWERRLAELTRQTAVAESELYEQEAALREWFDLLGPTSEQLSKAAAS
jgi:hypothetical protein